MSEVSCGDAGQRTGGAHGMKVKYIVLTVSQQDELLDFLKGQYLNPNVYPRVSALYDKIAQARAERQAQA